MTAETSCVESTAPLAADAPIRVLVVEDVDVNRELIRRVGWGQVEPLLRLLRPQLDKFAACDVGGRRHLQAPAHALRGSTSLSGFKALAATSRTLEDCCRMSQAADGAFEDAKWLAALVHEEITHVLSACLETRSPGSAQG